MQDSVSAFKNGEQAIHVIVIIISCINQIKFYILSLAVAFKIFSSFWINVNKLSYLTTYCNSVTQAGPESQQI